MTAGTTALPFAASTVDDVLVGLLPGILPATRERLSALLTVRRFSRGELVQRQGEPLQLLFVIEGVASVTRTSRDGRRYTLVLVTPRDSFGFRCVWRPCESMYEMRALTELTVAGLPGPDVRRLAQADPGLAVALFDIAAESATVVLERLDETTFETARTRLAIVLLAYEQLITGRDASISRDELASLIGTSREMLGQALRDFESRGILARNGPVIAILDREALKDAAAREGGGAEHTRWLRLPGERRWTMTRSTPRS